MARKTMINTLELSYNPICNYDFALVKDDELFRTFIRNSSIYIITQRRELTIELLRPEFHSPHQTVLHFEIRQKGNPSVLKCQIPMYQPQLAADINKEIRFHFEYALPKPNPISKTFPQNNIRNLLVYYHDNTFITWLSPENFIQNYLRGALEATVEGSIEEFIKYKVHYVGKSTEQEIWKRLTGHSTLQQILSLEYPLQYGTLPTHEIAILFLQLKDAVGLHTISAADPITEDFIQSLKETNLPPAKTISLDAEKALIKAMQPGYNKQFYNNYPSSRDGLSSYNLDGYSFQILSPVILEYKNGLIKGAPNYNADSILIQQGQPLKIISTNPHIS